MAALVAIVAIAYSVAVIFWAPNYIRESLINTVQDNCASCRMEIDEVRLSFFDPFHILLRSVDFSGGEKGRAEFKLAAKTVDVAGSLRRSTRERIVIDEITLDHPRVRFVDGDAVAKSDGEAAAKSEDVDGDRGHALVVQLGRIALSDGEFVYTRNTRGTSATLNIAKLRGEADSIELSGAGRDKLVEGRVYGQIEKSGEVEINLATRIKPGPMYVDVRVDLRDQNLSSVNSFFNPNAGVELEGTIEKARGRVNVRGDNLRAATWIVYHGLKLRLNSMYDRSKPEAFFMNVATELAMKEDDLDLDRDDQTRVITAKREPGERIVGFVLRGLKEASIKVALGNLTADSPREEKPQNVAPTVKK